MRALPILPVLLVISACSTSGPSDGPPDPADPLACSGATTRHYAVDHLELPYDAEDAIDGLDLDHDATPDNAGGFLLSSLFDIYATQHAADAWAAQIHARLEGDLTWIVSVESCGDTGAAQVSLHRGTRAGGVVHLVDTEPSDGEQPSRPALGLVNDGRVHAERGIGVAPLGALADLLGGADDAWHAGYGVGADVVVDDRTLDGLLGFGFGPPYRTVIGESFLGWLNALLDLGVSPWGAGLDRDDDGTITFEELDADTVFDVLLRPDLDLVDTASGDYWPGHDGVADSISFGVSIRASRVTVE